MKFIAGGGCIQHLQHLLRFLAVWKERPLYLAPMAYQWCSAFSKMITGPGQDGIYTRQVYSSRPLPSQWIGGALRGLEMGFAKVGPGCDPASRHQGGLDPHIYVDLLFTALEVGFRKARPRHDWSPMRLDHSPHHTRVFEVAFSSDCDEVIADAVCAWITGSGRAPAGSLARYFAKRMGRTTPFSPRLRQVGIRAACRFRPSELGASAPEIVRLLNRLEAEICDVEEIRAWANLLVGMIHLPVGLESLSFHNWRLLGELTSTTKLLGHCSPRDMEVMRSLEKAEDWEKLGVWMVVVWVFPPALAAETMPVVRQVTLKLSLRQTSALQRFENLCEGDVIRPQYKLLLRRTCDQARVEQSSSEPSPPPYVSVPPT